LLQNRASKTAKSRDTLHREKGCLLAAAKDVESNQVWLAIRQFMQFRRDCGGRTGATVKPYQATKRGMVAEEGFEPPTQGL
jgi:hypothetical protein